MANIQTLEGLRGGKYKGTKRLKISAGITAFPTEILSLFSTLEILDLSGNTSLSSLPIEMSRLHKLKIVFFSDCNFTTFPKELAQCRSLEMVAFKNNHMTTIPENSFPRKLRWLILTNNSVEDLPRSIGMCHRLQKCMLAGNRLSSLPEEMKQCRKLGLLRLSSNKFTELPEWLFELPELSFLSFAGNTLSGTDPNSTVRKSALSEISWSSLSVQQLLGEGASGIISQGAWKCSSGTKDVAIKVFKGDLTSDGSPADEMDACIAAGQHANLIDPLGSISTHPEGKRGLVLELIPPQYTNLGLPPTLSTCTRDVFSPETLLSVEKCKNILLGIAAAVEHLHTRGISHGDLYAHNILVDFKSGNALLGDFGAASVYGLHNERKNEFERLEVLAFGHLVEDLLGCVERRIDVLDSDNVDGDLGMDLLSEKDAGVIEGLNLLHWRCTNPVVLERPNFVNIKEALEGL